MCVSFYYIFIHNFFSSNYYLKKKAIKDITKVETELCMITLVLQLQV